MIETTTNGMIETTPNGIVIAVRVIPRAGKSGVAGTRGNAWLIRLTAPPVDGAANAELIELLAQTLRVPKRAVSILTGERGRQKRVQVLGVDAATAAQRLAGEA